MKSARFIQCLSIIGWSQRHLASQLGCDPNIPGRWATDRAEVPVSVAAWLDKLARHHQANPPPTWRTRA